MRAGRAAAAALLGLLLAGTPAGAAWSRSGSASGAASSTSLAAATSPAAAAAGTSVTVSWTNRANPVGTTYRVARTAGGTGTPATICTVPAGPCTEDGLAPGTYTYSVTPLLVGWTGTPVTATATVSVVGTSPVAGLALTTLALGGVPMTPTCGPVSASRTCVVASGSGNSRTFTFKVQLVSANGTAVPNGTLAAVPVTFTSTGGPAAPASASIAVGASSSGTVTYSLPNGSSGGTLTAKLTYNGTAYTLVTTFS